ncbi:hypothetical protein [Anaerocolumna xylanovorans]|uniref:Uncharacterized protein n=1 Tax=Anaerocolumna xylanovorans DSM 12503 TaxID=1121345 RepID=A0A1M7YM50_9FIRM|nr:hypothetical protein [Anaerocolumna xylanovorans]SHO53691.1 hypothetical protein SAMN02745217_04239 [Anaerocolumna xylanovorans DSM 12503]
MIKTNPGLKEITIDIRGAITRFITDGYFTEFEDGSIEYTPYFRDRNDVLAFALFALDGVQYEDGDDIFESIIKDEELANKFKLYKNNGNYQSITEDISDMVEFKKQQLLHKSKLDEAFESLNTLLGTMNEKLSQIDAKSMEKVIKKFNIKEVMKEYQKSGAGDAVRDKVIQEQAQKIKELTNEISAQSVLTDK